MPRTPPGHHTAHARLAVTAITPPLPDVDGLRRTFRARVVVIHANLVHRNVHRTIERDEREGCQIDLVDLIEDLLTHVWISRGLLLHEEFVQRWVAVEVKILSIRRELVTGKQRCVIGVVGPLVLKLEEVIPARYCPRRWGRVATSQERTKERAGRVVLDVDLDTNGLEVRLQDQLVVGAPQVIGRRRVLELQPHTSLGTNAI